MCLAIPGKVLEIEGDGIEKAGIVDFGGVRKRVNLAFAPDVLEGEYVMTHVGFAIAKVDEVEAQRVFALLGEIDALDELDSPQ